MNHLSVVKNKMKKVKKIAVPVVAAGAALLVTASTASAAIVWTEVTAAIATAVTDYGAGAVILLGAFAGIWGAKRVMGLFSK